MNQTMQNLWSKVVENRTLLIKVAGVAVGAAIGMTVASIVINTQESVLIEELTMEVEE